MLPDNTNKNLFKRRQNTPLNITERINGLHNRVLTKACVLRGIVNGISIGPNCTVDSLDVTPPQDVSGDASAETNGHSDQLDKSTNGCSSSTGSNDEEKLNDSNNTPKSGALQGRKTSTRKSRTIFDKERERFISIAVREKAALIKEKEQELEEKLRMKREEMHMQQAQIDLERERLRLQKEEECVIEAEYWRSVNDQLSVKRLIESNERVRRALEKQSEAERQHKLELKERRERLDKIVDHQILYRELYQQLQDATKRCKNPKELMTSLANETTKLKTINVRFESVINKCKGGSVSQSDVEEGDDVINQIKTISSLFNAKVDEINKSIEESEKQREEQAKAESVVKELPNQVTAVIDNQNTDQTDSKTAEANGLEDYVDLESFNSHISLIKFLEEYEESLEPLLKDDSMKKFRFSCQKAVITPVNAISPISHEHMKDKFDRLSRLLRGETVTLGDAKFSASSHPLGIKFCTNLMAKKFVSQGDQTVSSKPEAAFAIAGIAVSLWYEFPDFGELLKAHFQRECPYLIPALMPQLEGQSDEEYYKVLAYQYIDGKVESQDKFLKRMSGFMKLYAAMIISKPRSRPRPDHPLGLSEGWRWLAAIMNLEPRCDISATLILIMLDVAGSELLRCYGAQFRKILHLLCSEILPRIEKVTPEGCGGPVRRLKTFLENVLKTGQIPPPEGLYGSNIW
ncbi:nucleoporin GLE1 isoform X1 [Nilaparvata lugens]|uniref:nucleoporin GLE1 isoform X1 n=1 Tax=Nilaparvata lugens TaxID=108931 RepID=UPI00193D7A55|nr:nucleoporin GLE1 isoform X1 [Nilaparvata lugens]